MSMDKLFDGSDAHLLPGNAELIERLRKGYGDMYLEAEAADALEAADKRIAELEAAMVGWRADQKENIATAVEECKRANEAERKLAVAREYLTNIYQQTQEGATHALATEALIAIRQEVLAQIGGDE